MEAEKLEAVGEIKQLATFKQDAEKKRKQLEQQVQEISVKFADAERGKSELTDKVSKLQVNVLNIVYCESIITGI